jgi:formylmethanofuran dehydrogenase subunit E
MEHMNDKKAPDSGVVVCSQCRKDTPEHYMIWDGEKNTVCLWCDEAKDHLADYEPNPYHGTYSEE